jgi:Protein DA1
MFDMNRKIIGKVRILFILAVMFSIIPLYAAMRCSQCNGSIRGRYYNFKGKVFCSKRCINKTRPKCAVCGRTINRMWRFKGKDYCSQACLDKILPKCSVCNKPVRKGVSRKGKYYCSRECSDSTLKKCSMCGGRLRGRYMNIGGSYYCKNCASRPRCFCCQKPADGASLSDGRLVCKKCMKNPVTSMEQLKKIHQEVQLLLKDKLKLKTPAEVELRIVDFPTLQKKSPNYSEGIELGLFEYKCKIHTETKKNILMGTETSRTYKTDEKYIIYILSHLPEYKAKEVMAHELAHAWMQKYYSGISDLKIREGWAQYVAHDANRLMNQAYLNPHIENNKDPIYGDGYRLIKKMVDQKGPAALRREFRRQSQKK